MPVMVHILSNYSVSQITSQSNTVSWSTVCAKMILFTLVGGLIPICTVILMPMNSVNSPARDNLVFLVVAWPINSMIGTSLWAGLLVFLFPQLQLSRKCEFRNAAFLYDKLCPSPFSNPLHFAPSPPNTQYRTRTYTYTTNA